ncbi:MAG: carbohydrate ABC transporter permease [Cypionkella sp.]
MAVYIPLERRREWVGLGFVTPTLVIIALILVYPVIQTIILSFGTSSLDGFDPYRFVGLQNYAALWDDPRFWKSLSVTLVFTVISIPLELVLGVFLALLMNESFKGKGVARLAVLFPWAMPTALNALIWRWMYNADYGLFNAVGVDTGVLSGPVNWLGSETLAMGSMVVVSVWKTSSFMALIILAGLQSIPRDLFEAGRIDGMNRWQEFREITLPLIKGSIMVALIIRTMDALRTFELPFNLTDGGPNAATETLSLYAYKVIFQFVEFNAGAAIVVVQFLMIFALSLVYIFSLRSKD